MFFFGDVTDVTTVTRELLRGTGVESAIRGFDRFMFIGSWYGAAGAENFELYMLLRRVGEISVGNSW